MNRLKLLAPLSLLLALAACGGDGAPASTTTTLHGVAAVGAPISGATVTLHCAAGAATPTATTDADGNWSIELPNGTPPCAASASGGSVNGAANALTLYSLATGNGPSITVNITPLTDLALAIAVNAAAGTGLDAWFAGTPAATLAQVSAGLAAARADLLAALTAAGYTLPAGAFDPFSATITAGNAGDVYDALLDALAQAIAGAGLSYDDARNAATTGGELPQAPAGSDITETPLPADKLGASFVDAAAAHLWLQPDGAGGITAVDGSGDGLIIMTAGSAPPDGRVQLLNLPNTPGTYACGHASGSATLQMKISFENATDPKKTYVSSADNSTVLPGFECSVTVTHAGPFESQFVYGDGVIEGTYTAKLRQSAAECAGEGNCSPFKELLVSKGKFRMNKSGHYTPAPPAGSLAARVGKAFAGTFTLSCNEGNSGTQTHTVVISDDGSSTLDGGAIADATHPGQIGVAGKSVSASRVENVNNTVSTVPSVAVQFDDQGHIVTFPANIVSPAAGQLFFCSGVSGSVTPGAFSQTSEIAMAGRTQTLNCPAPSKNGTNDAADPVSPDGATTFTAAADGSVTLGNLAIVPADYVSGATFSATDKATFQSLEHTFELVVDKGDKLELKWTRDASGNTTKVHYRNNLETGTCVP